MPYNFPQMFQKRGVQGQPGGKFQTPPMPPVNPSQSGAGVKQQVLGPPVGVGNSGPDGGPTYHPGPQGQPPGVPPPAPGQLPGAPPPRPAWQPPQGSGMGQRPGGQSGAMFQQGVRQPGAYSPQLPQHSQGGTSGQGGGYQGPYYGDYRDYIPGGVYYVPGADPNIDKPGQQPGVPSYGPTQVPGGGRIPYGPGGPGEMIPGTGGGYGPPQTYMPYFNPNGGIRTGQYW